MKHTHLFRSALALALTGLALLLAASCSKKQVEPGTWDDSVVGYISVSGVVKDTFGNPLVDVDISFKGTDSHREVRKMTFTDFDGSYSIDKVPSNARFIVFEKEGFATMAYTIPSERFATGEPLELNPILEYANAVIRGKVLDATNGQPMEGVRIDCGSKSVNTASDGSYSIEGLSIKDYQVDYVAADGTKYTRNVEIEDFNGDIAELPTVRLGGEEILPGMKWQEMADAPVWYGNNFRGADGYGGINHWTVGYMSAFPVWLKARDEDNENDCFGHYRYEAEGCALVNMEGKGASYPEDRFIAYTYGRKTITEGNRYMNVNARTHYATASNPAVFGVKVVNLTDGSLTVDDIADYTHASSDFKTFTFDLGDYIGKEVFIAFGIYWRDYNFHLPCRRLFFTSADTAKNDDALTGVAVDGASWRGFTKENLTSLGINPGRSFSGDNFGQDDGETPNGVRRKHDPDHPLDQGYGHWAGTNHIVMSWTLQYVNQTVEPVNSEGYTIKTRANVGADYNTPETYLYSRFRILEATKNLHVYVRTFSSTNPTVFRVTAVPLSTCVAKALTPVANTANTAAAVADGNGCWQFLHEAGSGDPSEYARFDYDLSEYVGQDVVIAIGVYKGATSDGEQKLCIREIDFD